MRMKFKAQLLTTVPVVKLLFEGNFSKNSVKLFAAVMDSSLAFGSGNNWQWAKVHRLNLESQF